MVPGTRVGLDGVETSLEVLPVKTGPWDTLLVGEDIVTEVDV